MSRTSDKGNLVTLNNQMLVLNLFFDEHFQKRKRLARQMCFVPFIFRQYLKSILDRFYTDSPIVTIQHSTGINCAIFDDFAQRGSIVQSMIFHPLLCLQVLASQQWLETGTKQRQQELWAIRPWRELMRHAWVMRLQSCSRKARKEDYQVHTVTSSHA